jgi:hypothetical protein
MKYLSKIEKFLKSKKDNKKSKSFLVENVNYHKTKILNLGKVLLPDPKIGDLKLSVMPFENNGDWVSLPDGFKIWEKSFNEILKCIPLQEEANTHYITIDTKFFTQNEYLRREGVHMDGNFCVDPYFSSSILEKSNEYIQESSWGGSSFKTSWGGASPLPPVGEEVPKPFKTSWGGASPTEQWHAKKPEFKTSWGGASPLESPISSLPDEEESNRAGWGGAIFRSTKKVLKKVQDKRKFTDWLGETIKFKFSEGENGIYKLIRETKFEEIPNNGHVKMDWVLPYDINIPISEYVSGEKGGILTTSTEVGCQAWNGEFYGEILSEGSFEKMTNQLTEDKKIIFEKNQLYFMSSNTPHETLLIDKGKRRTFLRITLNHNYLNENIKKIVK